jgi:ABC-type antimicrobial peptide transport system permease subunit
VRGLHGAVDNAALAAAVRREVSALNRNIPMAAIKTMDETFSEVTAQARHGALLMALFASLALLMSLMGIYGVMSYAVASRTQEIGIRMALGAQQRDVLKLIVGQGLMLAMSGIAIGLIAAFALTRVLKSVLYQVSATDPLTFILISLLLTVAALLACWVPARQAAKVDPMVALRCE